MPLAHEITLPRTFEAHFPDRCVRCDAERPEHTWRHSSRSIGWWSVFPWGLGRKFTVDVPACVACASELSGERRLRMIVEGALMITGIAVGLYFLGEADPSWRKYAVMSIVIAFLAPAMLHRLFRPPLFDLTVRAKKVEYEFKNPLYAADFGYLNANRLGEIARQHEERARELSRRIHSPSQ